MRRPIRLERSLFRNLVLGPVLLGVALLAAFLYTERRLHEAAATELTNRAIAQMETALADYLRPVEEVADLSVNLGRSGHFTGISREQLDPILAALLKSVTQISSIHVASATGDEYMMLIEPPAGYYSRQSDVSDPGWIVERRWSDFPTADVAPSEQRTQSDYDSRQRVWHADALRKFRKTRDPREIKDRLVWSEPYTFYTTRAPGITVSTAYATPDGGTQILAFDILLNDILRFVEDIRLRESGIIFVMLRSVTDGQVVVLAVPQQNADNPAGLFPLSVAKLSGAPRDFLDAVLRDNRPVTSEPLRFTSEDVAWWGAIARSPLSSGKEIWIAATIPEAEILKGIPDMSIITLAAVALTVVALIFQARLLARRYGTPITALVAQTERFGRLNFTRSSEIESPIYEVQVLASSQETLRKSLSALTAMNDRGALAAELRGLPREMSVMRAGALELVLCDIPADPVGGVFVAAFAANRTGSAAWQKASADQGSGMVAILVETQLSGLRSGQHSVAMRACLRAALGRGSTLEGIHASLMQELEEGAGIAAPASVVVAGIDSGALDAQLVFSGAFVLMQAAAADPAGTWQRLASAGFAGQPERRMVEIKPGQRWVICSDGLFDLVDQQRNRLDHAEMLGWFAQLRSEPNATASHDIARRILDFCDPDFRRADVTFFGIDRAD